MVRRSLVGVLSLAALGCGPSAGGEPTLFEPAFYGPLAERCGSTDPIQLLALAPNEVAESSFARLLPAPSQFSFHRYGDRWLFIVVAYDREVTPTTYYDPEGLPANLVSSRIVSVDGCGGDMRVLVEADYAFWSIRPPTADEPWSACLGGRILVFDPDGEHAARFYPELECRDDVLGDAFITVTETDAEQSLVRARLPLDAPAEITTLVPRISLRSGPGKDPESRLVDVLGRSYYDLVEVHVPTGRITVLRSEVSSFDVSDDGRFVVWQGSGSEDAPYLWDRQTDTERRLGLPEWTHSGATGIQSHVAAAVPSDGGDFTQLTLLPNGEQVVLEGRWSGDERIGDTYVLRQSPTEAGAGSTLAIFEPGSQLPRPVPHGTLRSSWVHDESLWTLGVVDDADPSSLGLLELAAPDFEPRVVATDIWYPMRLADGRLLTVLDRDAGDRYGTLVLVDAEGPVAELDRDVLGTYSNMEPLVDDTVVYTVRDPEHERTGVWIAQIAPLPEP